MANNSNIPLIENDPIPKFRPTSKKFQWSNKIEFFSNLVKIFAISLYVKKKTLHSTSMKWSHPKTQTHQQNNPISNKKEIFNIFFFKFAIFLNV